MPVPESPPEDGGKLPPSSQAPAIDAAALTVALAAALPAAQEIIAEQRRARRRRNPPGRTASGKKSIRRGSVVMAVEPGLPGSYGIALGTRYREKRPRVWFPETNRIVVCERSAVRRAEDVERKDLRLSARASQRALAALDDEPGVVYDAKRTQVIEHPTGWGVARFRVGVGDRLISDPDAPPEQPSEDRGRDRGYDDEYDVDEYPPKAVLGIAAWRKYAPAIVWCYVPRYRLRLPFLATDLQRHVYDDAGLGDVVMPKGHREHLLDVVHRACNADDKGRGVNVLLYGPPGVGKTFTAHRLADQIGRPLIALDGRDLSGSAASFELRIKGVLQRADAWRAIILCDEADVLLSSRDGVTWAGYTVAMLRLLDSHEGVVILTSNRPFEIDDAFESRLHARLYFPELTAAARRKVWVGALERAGLPAAWALDRVRRNGGGPTRIDSLELDGREINIAIANTLSAASRAGCEPDAEGLYAAAERLSTECIHLTDTGTNEVGFSRSTAPMPEWE